MTPERLKEIREAAEFDYRFSACDSSNLAPELIDVLDYAERLKMLLARARKRGRHRESQLRKEAERLLAARTCEWRLMECDEWVIGCSGFDFCGPTSLEGLTYCPRCGRRIVEVKT